MKHIIADIGGSPLDPIILDAAWQVARRDAGHVTALHLRRDRAPTEPHSVAARLDRLLAPLDGVQLQPAAEDGYDGELAYRQERARTDFDRWRQLHDIALLEHPSAGDGVTASWRIERTSAQGALAHVARTADLTVMSRPAGREIDFSDDSDLVLLTSGRALLLLPATDSFRVTGDAMIAWDGSAEATRAVALALPLLACARRVSIFSRAPLMHSAEPADLVRYLGWHGVAAEPVGVQFADMPIGEELLQCARASRAGLLVMGAYRHSRWREAMLGGATQHVLDRATVPLLMAA